MTDKTVEAVERVTRYVAMRDAKPLRNQDDTIHGIHTGTEWAGEINLSDVRHLLSELSRLQAERDKAVEANERLARLGRIVERERDELAEELQIARDALHEAYERTGHADDLAAAHVADLALPPPVKEAEPGPVAWRCGDEGPPPRVNTTPPALQARVEALEGVTRDLRDRLLAFVGAVAEITDCSADVNAINRADALLDRAALTGEKGGEADGR